jgi:hypothetical protein
VDDIEALKTENARLRAAIVELRDTPADDRCIEDDDKLFAALGDGIKCDRRVGDRFEMLSNCARFIKNRCEDGYWKTYAELEAELTYTKGIVTGLVGIFIANQDMMAKIIRSPSLSYARDMARAVEETLSPFDRVSEDELKIPINMLLYCPACKYQHVDEPQPEKNWSNPPHRSHRCQNCDYQWRPSDAYTNGVLRIMTKGKEDETPDPMMFE